VAAKQVPLEALALGVADRAVAQRADAGCGAVQRLPSREHPGDRFARRLVAGAGRGGEFDGLPVPRHRGHRRRRERLAVEHDRRHG